MNIPWGLLIFLVGIAYGYMTPGKQDKSRIFWKGLIWGVIGAVVLAILGWVFKVNPLGLSNLGFFGFIWAVIVLTVVFIIGVFIGDLFDRRRGYSGRAMRRV